MPVKRDTVKRRSLERLEQIVNERSTPKPPKKKRDPKIPRVTKKLVRKIVKAARQG